MSAEEVISIESNQNPLAAADSQPPKKKRNLPGTPDPQAEVIALSPKALMATNRFLCEICGKGFQRDQNLQLHKRGHNLPWKLKQRSSKEVRKRVYVCPEKSCVHNHPSRALGDLTGIKKHFCRKHGEKKWKCEKCSKRYAVQSDWKAHSRTCGTREYRCDCGTIFSRRDSFITHRAFCDALAAETARLAAASNNMSYHFTGASQGPPLMGQNFSSIFKPIKSYNQTQLPIQQQGLSLWMDHQALSQDQESSSITNHLQEMQHHGSFTSSQVFPIDQPIVNTCSSNPPPNIGYQLNWDFGNKGSSNAVDHQELPNTSIKVPSLFSTHNHSDQTPSATMSATALLQKAAQMGANTSDTSFLGCFDVKSHENNMGNADVFCGLYGTNTNLFATSTRRDIRGSSAPNQLQMQPCKRRRFIQSEENVAAGGETRDFLGVGIQSICAPSSVNGWI